MGALFTPISMVPEAFVNINNVVLLQSERQNRNLNFAVFLIEEKKMDSGQDAQIVPLFYKTCPISGVLIYVCILPWHP